MMRVIITIYAICLLPVAVSAQTPGPDTSLINNPVYEKHCAKCHGKSATGRHFGGPSLASQSVTSSSGDDLRKTISDGKGHMPKFAGKLTPQEIDQLVAAIKAQAKQ